MKIKFKVYPEKKEIVIFFKNGELYKVAQELMDRFPNKTLEEKSKIGSNVMALYVQEAIEIITKKTKLPINDFKPKFIAYKKRIELPKELRSF